MEQAGAWKELNPDGWDKAWNSQPLVKETNRPSLLGSVSWLGKEGPEIESNRILALPSKCPWDLGLINAFELRCIICTTKIGLQHAGLL